MAGAPDYGQKTMVEADFNSYFKAKGEKVKNRQKFAPDDIGAENIVAIIPRGEVIRNFIYTGALSEEQRSSYWPINNFFEILKNILFCVSFIMKKRYNNPYAVDSFEP